LGRNGWRCARRSRPWRFELSRKQREQSDEVPN
jgi:hypothetical protein